MSSKECKKKSAAAIILQRAIFQAFAGVGAGIEPFWMDFGREPGPELITARCASSICIPWEPVLFT